VIGTGPFPDGRRQLAAIRGRLDTLQRTE